MSELLQAAKAVIDLYDYTGPLDECEAINRLIAAVDRAEKQKYTGFEEWWDKNADLKYKFVPIGQAKQLWNAASTAAQQAERERCAILCERLPYGSGLAGKTYAEALRGVGHGGELAAGTDTNLEKIDD